LHNKSCVGARLTIKGKVRSSKSHADLSLELRFENIKIDGKGVAPAWYCIVVRGSVQVIAKSSRRSFRLRRLIPVHEIIHLAHARGNLFAQFSAVGQAFRKSMSLLPRN